MPLVKTGYKKYNRLIEIFVDTGEATGNWKINDVSDNDYIAPVWDPDTCPYIGYDGDSASDIPDIFTITASVSPANGGTISFNPNNTSFISGETVVITANPATGYEFDSWAGNVGTVTGNIATLEMDTDKNISANFILQKRIFTLTTSSIGSNTLAQINVKVDGVSTTIPVGNSEFDYGTEIELLNTTGAIYNTFDSAGEYQQIPIGHIFTLTEDVELFAFRFSL